MKFIIKILVVFSCTLSVLNAYQEIENVNSKIKKIDELIVISSIDKQIKLYSEMMVWGVRQDLSNEELLKDINKDLIYYTKMSFQSSAILENLKADLNKALTEKDLIVLFDWQQPIFTDKIIPVMDRIPSSLEEYNQISIKIKESNLLSNKERLALIEEIDFLLGGSDFTIELARKTLISSSLILFLSKNIDNQISIKKLNMKILNNIVDKMLEKKKVSIKRSHLSGLVYLFKDLSIQELKSYIRWLKKPSVIKYYTEVTKSLDLSLNSAMNSMLESLVLVYEKYKTDN